MTRRDFLRSATLASLGIQLGLPSFAAHPTGRKSTRLVVIHLFGGNDGLNTIIPATDMLYRKLRPELAISPQNCIDVGRGLYFHPALQPLVPLWTGGKLCVINGVGYPHSKHSHFISSDIWHGGGPDEHLGWLGRAADLTDLQTVQVSRSDQARALWAERHQPLCVDPEQSRAADLDLLLRHFYDADEHLGETFRNMERLKLTCPGEGLKAKDLSLSLKWIAKLLPEARVFHTTMAGFDTHSGQSNRHAQALEQLATALASFWKELERTGWADSTSVMVFSEFGRRVEENQSGGTDHGTAGPVFLLGNSLRGGWQGDYPSLAQLDEGDLRYQVDFRQVYATLLEDWLEIDSHKILGGNYDALRCFR
jgi:uncharacterized protein (DUF1501 family)